MTKAERQAIARAPWAYASEDITAAFDQCERQLELALMSQSALLLEVKRLRKLSAGRLVQIRNLKKKATDHA